MHRHSISPGSDTSGLDGFCAPATIPSKAKLQPRPVEALLKSRHITTMNSEWSRDFSSQEISEAKRQHNHIRLRKTAKDLREHAVQSGPSFPNRARLLQLTAELLDIVPPVSAESEQLDERRRSMDRGEIEPFSE